jgi:hypothetical protein
MKMNTLPFCAKCNKPVDKVTRYDDDYKKQLIFTAYCHGEKEEVRVPFEDLVNTIRFEFGTAFNGNSVVKPKT